MPIISRPRFFSGFASLAKSHSPLSDTTWQ